MRTLYKFHGGVHPPTHKEESTRTPIAQAAIPSKLVIPLHQHVGNRAVPDVQVGQHVPFRRDPCGELRGKVRRGLILRPPARPRAAAASP